MLAKKYKVALSVEERQTLEKITTRGKTAAYKMNRARILLKADENRADGGWGDQAISNAMDVSVATIERVRQQFVEQGLDESQSIKDAKAPQSIKDVELSHNEPQVSSNSQSESSY